MPRGVYDRSKIKRKTDTSEAPTQKRKYTRRVSTETTASFQGDYDDVVSHINVLAGLRASIANSNNENPKILTKIDDMIFTMLSSFPNVHKSEGTSAASGQSQQAASSPLPFNPPTASGWASDMSEAN